MRELRNYCRLSYRPFLFQYYSLEGGNVIFLTSVSKTNVISPILEWRNCQIKNSGPFHAQFGLSALVDTDQNLNCIWIQFNWSEVFIGLHLSTKRCLNNHVERGKIMSNFHLHLGQVIFLMDRFGNFRVSIVASSRQKREILVKYYLGLCICTRYLFLRYSPK